MNKQIDDYAHSLVDRERSQREQTNHQVRAERRAHEHERGSAAAQAEHRHFMPAQQVAQEVSHTGEGATGHWPESHGDNLGPPPWVGGSRSKKKR